MSTYSDPYPPGSTADQGQMTADEAEIWKTYLAMVRLDKNQARSFEDDETLEELTATYQQSGHDFDDCVSIGDHWPHYFAVETDDVVGLINHLTRDYQIELIDLAPDASDARQEILKSYNRYFLISPPCDGHVFVHWTGIKLGKRSSHHQAWIGQFTHDWKEVSKQFGDVFFISQSKDDPGFIYWHDGKVERAITGSADKFNIAGRPISGEHIIFLNAREKRLGDMEQMIDQWHINPQNLHPVKPGQSFLAWMVDG